MSKSPIRVAITGAAGQIGYSLLFRIASGAAFGPDQPVILHLIEIPDPKALAALNGVCMELDDCAFPLLKGLVPTSSLDEGFRDVNWALLVGAVPRKQGMERITSSAPECRMIVPGFTVVAVPNRFHAGQSRTSGIKSISRFMATAPPRLEPTTTSGRCWSNSAWRCGRRHRNRRRAGPGSGLRGRGP